MRSALKYQRLMIVGLLASSLWSGYAVAGSQDAAGSATNPATDASSTLNQEPMTPERFREIAARPGDLVPLVPQLSQVPIWTNAAVTIVMKYASGRTATEQVTQTAHTISGKYIVYTINSELYHRTMNSIMAFDQKASALKVYGLYDDGHGGEVLTEAVVNYDFEIKAYSATSTYGDGFKEVTTGSYTSLSDFSRTTVLKNGALFMIREVTVRPAPPSN